MKSILPINQLSFKAWILFSLRISMYVALIPTLLLIGSNVWMIQSQKAKTFTEQENIPFNQVGLVLGTSRYMVNGQENLFFKSRIEAAANLYCSGKIKHILVSGDNGSTSYNEPRAMYKALREEGVAAEDISMDYAGFRTLDSVVRSKVVFQQDSITIISQGFHNYRALFIAEHYGIEAVAFNADPEQVPSQKPYLREYLARVKGVLDLYVLKKQPKFLGDEIHIPL